MNFIRAFLSNSLNIRLILREGGEGEKEKRGERGGGDRGGGGGERERGALFCNKNTIPVIPTITRGAFFWVFSAIQKLNILVLFFPSIALPLAHSHLLPTSNIDTSYSAVSEHVVRGR